ncbi:MAG TPA: pilus assembly protein TadG-related protein [Candidatus Polarisedimenticolia bacterium]|nr:pilus assembly protein TadG-related protein [Candidatus Polarisedimenticolia bacterium]
MSSTTDRRRRAAGRERGQVLAIFAFGLVGIMAVAALVFDVGQNLFERRKQQDAADAAALAGARFMVESGSGCKTTPNKVTCKNAVDAAEALAEQHGYAPSQIQINIPPTTTSNYSGFPGHIQVTINSARDSFFAGVLGLKNFSISAMAVAGNLDNYPFPYSFLALGTGCKAGHIGGNGNFDIQGNVFVNSTCENPGALVFDGNSTTANITGDCGAAGAIGFGPAIVTCGSTTDHQDPISDPLAGLGPPLIGSGAVPDPPTSLSVVGGTLKTSGPNSAKSCPGGALPGTAAAPKLCKIEVNSGSPVVRMYPGVYFGGVEIQEGPSDNLTIYMEPGIYYMAGGGFLVNGAVDITTVASGTTTYGGGVLIFNGDDPTYTAACNAGTAPGGACIGAFDFQNTTGGTIAIHGYTGPTYTTIVVFQDRDASAQPPVKLTGNSTMMVEGTFYLPKANFQFNGNGGSFVLDAQIICDAFDVQGNGSLTVTYVPGDGLLLSLVGLVQ